MINSAKQYNISELFAPETKIQYIIPKYQREYIWNKDQWELFFNDLQDNDSGYFLGSIICVNHGTDALDTAPLEVIDGQQRLTSLSLLYAAIFERLTQEQRNDEDFITEKTNLKYRLIQKNAVNQLRLELSHQKNNMPDFKAILHELNLYAEANYRKPAYLGVRKIYKVYKYFKDRIKELEDFESVINFLSKVNQALLVKMEVSSNADAYTLFECLNNRGVPLSAMDLIKNKMLYKLDTENIMPVEEAFNDWVKLTDYLPDYSVQERFLRQYYNAFRYNVDIAQEGFPRATKSKLIKIYERLIDKTPKVILEDLLKKADIYSLFAGNHIDGQNINDYPGIIDLQNLGAAPSYMLLLYLFSEHPEDQDLLNGVAKFLVKYFVRRNLTDFPNTRNLDTIFMALIDKCEINKEGLEIGLIVEELTRSDRFADDSTFINRLKGNIYEDNTAAARFVLCKLEESHRTREIHTDLWEKDKSGKRYIWTIEHIFPEGKNIPEGWVEMVAGGKKEDAENLQTEWVHKLGNLTLTGYNSNLSNFEFLRKRDRQDRNGNYIGYKNGLFLNNTLAETDRWSVKDIKKRTELLASKAMELFKVQE